MRRSKSLFCHIQEVVNAKIPYIYVMYSTSKIHPFSLGNYLGTSLIVGHLMRIRVTSVDWTWLRLEWPPA